MARGAWDPPSQILAQFFNAHRDPKKHREPIAPQAFNPYRGEPEPAPRPLSLLDLPKDLAKDLVKKQAAKTAKALQTSATRGADLASR